MRLAKANKVARKRLRVAEQFMKEGKSEQFYDEMAKALWGYLSDKLSMPLSQLTRDNVAERLTAYGAPEALAAQFIAVIDDCEMARYTPSQSQGQMDEVYHKATETINSLESVNRNRK